MDVPLSVVPVSPKTFADTTKSSSFLIVVSGIIRSYNKNGDLLFYNQNSDATYNTETKQIDIKSRPYTRVLFMEGYATGGAVTKGGTCKVGYVTSDNNIMCSLTLSLVSIRSRKGEKNSFVIPKNTTLSFGVRAISSGSTAPIAYVETFTSYIKIV